jgi:AraC family transcriptional regulator
MMKYLRTADFFGETNQTVRLDGITLTDTVYTHEYVDWHYHENAYFTFILEGRLIEGNSREKYNCTAGGLLFHNWQETHYNIKPEGFTRGFHIELDREFFKKTDLGRDFPEGSFRIEDTDIRLLAYRIFRETKIDDTAAAVSVEALLLKVLAKLARQKSEAYAKRPVWVKRLKEILYEDCADRHSLGNLSRELNIHPVHLSRDFSRYFGCNLGEYIRKMRIEKALSLLPAKDLSLTDIAYRCGFADHSHFIRCFKQIEGATPSEFRRILT